MCLNCGCGDAASDRGKPENITISELREAAAANGQTLRESAQHILETVEAYETQSPVASMAGGTGSTGSGSEGGDSGLGRPAGSQPAPPAPHGTPGSES
jgi:hypothetical protein